MTSQQFLCGSAALLASSLYLATPAAAQEPGAGQDLSDKTVWMAAGSRLRDKPGLSPFGVYLHTKTALQLTGRGRCEPAADCPVRFDGRDLWVRRTQLSLSAPAGVTFGGDGRPSTGTTTAGSGPTGMGVASGERWLRPGETGDEVRRLQEQLNAKGFRVTADGSYGPGTEQAVSDFQRSAGLPVDGVAGIRVRDALAASSGVATMPAGGTGTPLANLKERLKEKFARFKERLKGITKPGQPEIYRTLRNGDAGDDVRLLQEILIEHGFKVTIDGQYGGGTEEAVRQFQRRAGLNVDGSVGPLTLERLAG